MHFQKFSLSLFLLSLSLSLSIWLCGVIINCRQTRSFSTAPSCTTASVAETVMDSPLFREVLVHHHPKKSGLHKPDDQAVLY